ncbi:hypothetical protein CKA32_005720 [Geitlerinema sp. FC II]|nr:hypothetical protein CKA32_005720 [Geitlerinema sp. FC II]
MQKSPETLVRKDIAVLKGWPQNPRSVNGGQIPGILEMPGIWPEPQFRFYVFCQSPISKSFLHH